MKPTPTRDTTHHITRAELLLYAATLAFTLAGSYLSPWGWAIGA